MRRRITNLREVTVQVNGKPARLTLASVIAGRLQDGIFGRDLAGLEAAEEIAVAVAVGGGTLEISEPSWERLVAAVRKPQSAAYAPGIATQLLPFLRAIINAEQVSDDG